MKKLRKKTPRLEPKAKPEKTGKTLTFKNEGDVKKRVKEILDEHGWFWWSPMANAFGKAGVADRLALRRSVFLAVETKFGSNKPTENQKAFLQSIHAEGGVGFVVNDKTIAVFDVWVTTFCKSTDAVMAGGKLEDADAALMLDCAQILTADIAAPPRVKAIDLRTKG